VTTSSSPSIPASKVSPDPPEFQHQTPSVQPLIVAIFSVVQPEMQTKVRPPSSFHANYQQSIEDTAARVLQCFSILASTLTNDENQQRMDEILKMLKGTWIRRRIAGDRRGFVVGKLITTATIAAAAEA